MRAPWSASAQSHTLRNPMKRSTFLQLLLSLGVALGAAGIARAEGEAAAQKRAEAKAERMVAALQVEDAAKAARAKAVVADWLVAMGDWHKAHDAKLGALWAEWGRARAVVPKDEFPGEVIAHRIDEVYDSLRPAYHEFIAKLSAELTPEQVDAFKEAWSRSPGMRRTYNAFLEIVPDLKEDQKKVILDRMLRAREDAMLSDSDREIVNIYKRHKVKVEAYVGTLEWAKLHSAFARRGAAGK